LQAGAYHSADNYSVKKKEGYFLFFSGNAPPELSYSSLFTGTLNSLTHSIRVLFQREKPPAKSITHIEPYPP
jgi:hypothetical protein